MANNTTRGVKKSAFSSSTSVPSGATFDYVSGSTNYKISYDNLLTELGATGTIVQGGDPTGTGRGGDSIWEMPFVDEVSGDVLFDKPGLLAMANSGPNTNKSQFFITTKETPHLNKKHTIFGEVISGLDVVKKIESAPTDSKDKPKEEQKIVKAYIGR